MKTNLGDVDLLNLQEVEDVGKSLQREELSSANVLLTLWEKPLAYEGGAEILVRTSTLKFTISSKDEVVVEIESTTSRKA